MAPEWYFLYNGSKESSFTVKDLLFEMFLLLYVE